MTMSRRHESGGHGARKKPEQLELNLAGKSDSPKKPAVIRDRGIRISGISAQKINEVLAHAPYFPPRLLSQLKTRSHVEQRIRSVESELKTTEEMLRADNTHHTEIAELRQDLRSLSTEKAILKKLLE